MIRKIENYIEKRTSKPRASGDDPFMCVSNQEREG